MNFLLLFCYRFCYFFTASPFKKSASLQHYVTLWEWALAKRMRSIWYYFTFCICYCRALHCVQQFLPTMQRFHGSSFPAQIVTQMLKIMMENRRSVLPLGNATILLLRCYWINHLVMSTRCVHVSVKLHLSLKSKRFCID